MDNLKEYDEIYEEIYKNSKISRDININKSLWKKYQKFCIDMDEAVSSRIRKLIIKDMEENN